MWAAYRRWAYSEVRYRLSGTSESDEVQWPYRGLYVCRRIMQVWHQRFESGLVGDPQVGRHAAGTSACSLKFAHTSENNVCRFGLFPRSLLIHPNSLGSPLWMDTSVSVLPVFLGRRGPVLTSCSGTQGGPPPMRKSYLRRIGAY